jgi:hypothetical protein
VEKHSNNNASPAWTRARRPVSPVISAVLLAAALAAPVQHARGAESEEEIRDWKESDVALPAYPKPDALIPFAAGAATPHRFFIDPQSLSIGPDGVVRYTLVVKTAGGATNVTHEGVRCEVREQKIYAIGGAKGDWVRARDPQWRRIEYRAVNNHHGVLYADFLCEGKYTPPSVKAIVQLLRKPPPRPLVDG